MRVSGIRVKRIRVNQGLGVLLSPNLSLKSIDSDLSLDQINAVAKMFFKHFLYVIWWQNLVALSVLFQDNLNYRNNVWRMAKMKRDTQQKAVFFLLIRQLFCRESLFIFGCMSYVTALTSASFSNCPQILSSIDHAKHLEISMDFSTIFY